MAAWHYDLFLVETKPVEVSSLISRLTRDLAPLPSPSSKLLLWGDVEKDRIDFWSDHKPMQLLVRFDLRAPSDSFRRLVLDLANSFSLRLLNADDVEIPPEDSALMRELQRSPAWSAANSPVDENEDEEEDGIDSE